MNVFMSDDDATSMSIITSSCEDEGISRCSSLLKLSYILWSYILLASRWVVWTQENLVEVKIKEAIFGDDDRAVAAR